ncbi:hypothetical protein FRC11_003065, partial [Ceratobasidium sp. 423]
MAVDAIETEITVRELGDLFCANLTDINDRAYTRRRDVEKQLVCTILAERVETNEFESGDPNMDVGFTLTVKGSAEPLKHMSFLTSFLLRADTIFCRGSQPASETDEF